MAVAMTTLVWHPIEIFPVCDARRCDGNQAGRAGVSQHHDGH